MIGASLQDETSRHKCLVYEGHPAEQLPVVVPLLMDGLQRNERCLYLGDPDTIAMVRSALAAHGVAVDEHAARGALIFSSDRPADDAPFDPEAMVAMLVTAIDDAVRAGFSGLCATGDMRWELGADANFDRLLEYEARLERVFREKPLRGICQYNREAVPAHAIHDALIAHRSVHVGGRLHRDNLFYVPPELLLGSVNRDALGRWMYEQLTRIVAAEQSRDRALDALADANRDLEHRVQRRTAELEAANHDLQAFSYSVSHDLRAPVRHVEAFARLLDEGNAAALSAEGRRHLARIRDAAAHMHRLIDGMLALGRIGQQGLQIESVDLSAIAASIVAALRLADPRRQVDVTIEPDLRAHGDSALLHAVLDNLIGNAWKFTAQRERARIDVRREVTAADEDVFRVSDNGAGFDMAGASQLFGLFQRMHRQEEFSGTGVGLATVQRILQRHGGRIWYDAAVDRGATFYVALPRDPSVAAPL